jgi:hypothetical protein
MGREIAEVIWNYAKPGASWSGELIMCPLCPEDREMVIHHGRPVVFGKECSWYDADSSIVIPFICEDGHRWLVQIGFNSGATFCHWAEVPASYETRWGEQFSVRRALVALGWLSPNVVDDLADLAPD